MAEFRRRRVQDLCPGDHHHASVLTSDIGPLMVISSPGGVRSDFQQTFAQLQGQVCPLGRKAVRHRPVSEFGPGTSCTVV